MSKHFICFRIGLTRIKINNTISRKSINEEEKRKANIIQD